MILSVVHFQLVRVKRPIMQNAFILAVSAAETACILFWEQVLEKRGSCSFADRPSFVRSNRYPRTYLYPRDIQLKSP